MRELPKHAAAFLTAALLLGLVGFVLALRPDVREGPDRGRPPLRGAPRRLSAGTHEPFDVVTGISKAVEVVGLVASLRLARDLPHHARALGGRRPRLPPLRRGGPHGRRGPRGAWMNRLAHESSPYLLQHADNPVDWYPWGDEALARAREEDKPILLSVGYAACHWCHVMEHESFEDEETAALMNERFVPIKVDREERPDVDGLYMEAVVALTGHGGWPLTVFLTPDGRPFWGGTYFPPEPRHGLPSFRQVPRGDLGRRAAERGA